MVFFIVIRIEKQDSGGFACFSSCLVYFLQCIYENRVVKLSENAEFHRQVSGPDEQHINPFQCRDFVQMVEGFAGFYLNDSQ